MATKNASAHQGEVKDPEHDGRLKGHKGGEAAKAHADGSHPDEKGHAKKAGTKAQDEGDHAAKADHGKGKPHEAAKADEPQETGSKHTGSKDAGPKAAEAKAAEAKATEAKGSDDADLKSREYTDAQGNVHHHTKAYMESHKGS